MQEDLRRIYETYNRLPDEVKNRGPDGITGEIVRQLNAAGDLKLKRKIRNFARSFFVPDLKV